jgi:hypothetical protein
MLTTLTEGAFKDIKLRIKLKLISFRHLRILRRVLAINSGSWENISWARLSSKISLAPEIFAAKISEFCGGTKISSFPLIS